MPTGYTLQQLHRWCGIPADDLPAHPELKVPFRLVADSAEMGEAMADLHALLARDPSHKRARQFKALILEKLDDKGWH